MEEYLPLIIQLLTGALGGNIAGKLLKNLSLGAVGNTIAGLVGGGIGGQLLAMLGVGAGAASGMDTSGAAETVSGGMDMSTILTNIAGGGVGGGVVMAIVGAIKNAMAKK